MCATEEHSDALAQTHSSKRRHGNPGAESIRGSHVNLEVFRHIARIYRPSRREGLDYNEGERRERRLGLREAVGHREPSMTPKRIAKTFAPMTWLTDASIAMVYSLLAPCDDSSRTSPNTMKMGMEHKYDGHNQCADPLETVLLMDPAVAFWLSLGDDAGDCEEALVALKIKERKLILCPINDNQDGSRADAGSHWSLLVCWSSKLCADDGQNLAGGFGFAYYDSMRQYPGIRSQNLRQATRLASRLSGETVKVVPSLCAHQTNSFDCGVYVILFSAIILEFLKRAHGPLILYGSPVWEDRLAEVTPNEVDNCRLHYYKKLRVAASASASAAQSTARL